MPVLAENIPHQLRQLHRWVCWRWVWNLNKYSGKGGWDKPLFDPRTSGHAKSNTPSTWVPFGEALRAHQHGDYDGVGIVLGHVEEMNLTLAGVDLDDVRDPQTGALDSWADWTLRRLSTYAEVSPSGTGVKATCWGQLPTGRRQDEETGVEMYDAGRYWTVTGRRLPGMPGEVMDRAEMLRQLHAELLGPKGQSADHDSSLSDRDLALSALAGLHARRAVGYSSWLGVGMALHSVDSSAAMLAEWDRWSRLAPDKYTEGVCAKKWASFKGRGITIGSLIFWAREDGWVHPGQVKAAESAPPAVVLPSDEQITLAVLNQLLLKPHLAVTLDNILNNARRGD